MVSTAGEEDIVNLAISDVSVNVNLSSFKVGASVSIVNVLVKRSKDFAEFTDK